MARRPRYIPPGSLVEASCRAIGSRFLLRPSEDANDLIAGILARAARLYPVQVVYFTCLSSHWHGLLVVPDAQRLADFMRYLQGNLAKELGRLHHWKGRLWGRRYSGGLVSEEEEAQVGRLKYLISNSVKEGLVERVADWPGLHAAHQILADEPLVGTWVSRSYEYRQRRCGKKVDPEEASTTEILYFSQLPCWEHLSPEAYRARIADLVAQVEEEARVVREAEGIAVLGRRAILRQDPHRGPQKEKRSPLPLFHTAGKEALLRLREAYQAFLLAYTEASARLRDGYRDAEFPENCFPPGLPFVPAARAGPALG